LSLMGTMFSLRVVEFPVQLHLKYVLTYMFAVSVSVIVPLIGLVIYTTRAAIRKLFDKIKKRIALRRLVPKMKWSRRKKGIREKWDGSGVGSNSSTADLMDIRNKPKRRPIWRRKKKASNQEVGDSEKGIQTEAVVDAV
jgi:hypothetical protein